MTIAKRLYLLVFIMAAALSALSGAGVYQMEKVYNAANFANANTVPSLLTLANAYDALAHLRVSLWQQMALTDPAKKAEKARSINEDFEKIAKAFDRYESEDVADAKDKALLADERGALALYKPIKDQVIALSNAGQSEAAQEAAFVGQDVVTKLTAAISAHRQYNQDLGTAAALSARAILQTSLWTSILISLVAVLAIGGMGILLAKKIVSSLREAVLIAETVAAGDLTHKIVVASSDETGQLLRALKKMSDSLVSIVGEVRSGTNAIATASSEIAAGNHDLSARTEQQAGALEETASSMEELTSTVKQNSDNATQANALASTASDVAVTGGKIVSQVIEKMGSITESSRKIAEIIGVIDGIAFQTNILALNAAVEAARAGEQGRGFAVVATEVRNLAHRSATAAKEIKALIDDSVEHVESGSKLVTDAGAVMQKVVDSVARVSDVMAEITTASHEQTAGIEQINQAVIHMDETTQQNAALVEQAAAAASSLQEQASNLAQVVSVFRLEGASANAGRIAAAQTVAKPPVQSPKSSIKRLAAPAQRQAKGDSRIAAHSAMDAKDWEEF